MKKYLLFSAFIFIMLPAMAEEVMIYSEPIYKHTIKPLSEIERVGTISKVGQDVYYKRYDTLAPNSPVRYEKCVQGGSCKPATVKEFEEWNNKGYDPNWRKMDVDKLEKALEEAKAKQEAEELTAEEMEELRNCPMVFTSATEFTRQTLNECRAIKKRNRWW